MSSTELESAPTPELSTLFAATTPHELIALATDAANNLSDVIKQRKLYQRIGTRDHVLVEGWQACGTLVGVFAVKDGGVRQLPWPDDLPDNSPLTKARHDGLAFGFIAAYKAVKDNREIGWGEGRCTRSETNWRTRDDYALSSMAQTRGQSRALRQPLGFIVSLAGYATTPAEELAGDPTPTISPIAPDDLVAEAAQAVQKLLPSVDAVGYLRVLGNSFDPPGVPTAAAKALTGLAWFVSQPQASGNVRETEPTSNSKDK